MDTDHPKTKDLQVDLAKNNKKRFDTLNYEFDRPLPIRKQTSYCIKKRGIGQNSNEKGVCIRTKDVQLFDGYVDKRAIIIKRLIKFKDHKNCLNKC